MRKILLAVVLVALIQSRTALADRQRVFSVQGSNCGSCEDEVGPYLKKLKGVKSWSFDPKTSEFTMTLADNVADQVIITTFERQGCYRAVPGAGQGATPGAYKAEAYPAGADLEFVTEKGQAVGPLEKLAVPGKYTVLDFYADWCGPCHAVDRQLRDVTATRKDIAIRKLNVVNFETPLARQLGRKLKALPFVVVFDPNGKRTEISGNNPRKLAAALAVPG